MLSLPLFQPTGSQGAWFSCEQPWGNNLLLWRGPRSLHFQSHKDCYSLGHRNPQGNRYHWGWPLGSCCTTSLLHTHFLTSFLIHFLTSAPPSGKSLFSYRLLRASLPLPVSPALPESLARLYFSVALSLSNIYNLLFNFVYCLFPTMGLCLVPRIMAGHR